jgi:hypothetical protein
MGRTWRHVAAFLVLVAPSEALAQGRHYGSWAPFAAPPREVSASISGWSLMNETPARSIGGRFSRNLSNEVAIEADVDVGRAEHRRFGVGTVQLRVTRGAGRPGFLTAGFVYGVASRRHPNAPRDNGFSVGGGVLLPVTASAALRGDARFMLFRRNYGAVRLTGALTVGLR